MNFYATDAWKTAWPGAVTAVMAVHNLTNPETVPELDTIRVGVAEMLRSRFAAQEKAGLRALPVLRAYADYYGAFKKTYHVQLQLESVIWKGKEIPAHSGAVTSMFIAELKNMLLTAGHDLDRLNGAVRVDAAGGDETYQVMSGQEQALKPGDMYMADGEGIISSVLSGPDARTRITPQTTQALFAVYAPPGIGLEAVRNHLKDIGDLIQRFCPTAQIDPQQILQA